jgi:hypothetical protein
MGSNKMAALTTPTELSVAPAKAVTPSGHAAWIIVRIAALTVLFSLAAVYEARQVSAVNAPEIWVHLRTGLWILQNRAVPHTALFSQSTNLPWNDSTWGFDVVFALAYRLFGLRGIPILLMILKLALAAALFFAARLARASFWSAVALAALGQYVIGNLQPLPYVFSILFFALELGLLFRVRYTGEIRLLFSLPVLFVVWANLHVQFVIGLLLLALFLFSLWIEHGLRVLRFRWLDDRIVELPLTPVSIVTGISFIATFLTPYTVHLLPNAFAVLYSPAAFEHFSEMASMGFRRPLEYMLMLLVMAAYLALGRRRSLAVFELLALTAGMAVAFRIQRDAWAAALPAVVVLANGSLHEFQKKRKNSKDLDCADCLAGFGLSTVIVLIAALFLPHQETLMARVSQNFPVKACNYIRDNRLPQPIFNAYLWGSFLTWYLPEYPVVVDSRAELYGNDQLGVYFDIVGGAKRLEDEPMVAHAGTLLLDRQSAMTKALTNLPGLKSQYRLVYSDDMASVFVPVSVHVEAPPSAGQ